MKGIRRKVGTSRYEHVKDVLQRRRRIQAWNQTCGLDDYLSTENLIDDFDDFGEGGEVSEVTSRRTTITLDAVPLRKKHRKPKLGGKRKSVAASNTEATMTIALPSCNAARMRSIMLYQQLSIRPRLKDHRARSEELSRPSLEGARSKSAPAKLGCIPVVLKSIAAVAKVTNPVNLIGYPWFWTAVQGNRSVALLVMRMSRAAEGGFNNVRVRPLVGMTAEAALSIEHDLLQLWSCAGNVVTQFRRMRRALKKALLQQPKTAIARIRPPYATALKKALRSTSRDHYDLWLASREKDGENLMPSLHAEAGCAVCLEKQLDKTSSALSACGHACCGACWTQYLKSEASKGSWSVCCPAGCGNRISLEATAVLAGDGLEAAETVLRLARWRNEAAVISGKSMRWCPHCGERALTRTASMLVCLPGCGKVFCAECELPGGHLGTPCAAFKKFQDACGVLNEEEKSAVYIRKYTRPCPKCGTPIEKNGGCLHVTCSRCKYVLCWACGGPGTGPGSCGSFQCRDTGFTGLGNNDRVGGLWAWNRESDETVSTSWVGIPADPAMRDADALAAQRAAVSHRKEALAKRDDAGLSAAHFALYLLYLRRWAELAGADGCWQTDSRKSDTSNLACRAVELKAKLAAMQAVPCKPTPGPASQQDQTRKARTKARKHLNNVPEFDRLIAKQELDSVIAQSTNAFEENPLSSFTYSATVAALSALAERGRGRETKDVQSKAHPKTKARRPTITSHRITNHLKTTPNPAPWQRGFHIDENSDSVDEVVAVPDAPKRQGWKGRRIHTVRKRLALSEFAI